VLLRLRFKEHRFKSEMQKLRITSRVPLISALNYPEIHGQSLKTSSFNNNAMLY